MFFIEEENFAILVLKSITNTFKDRNFVKELVDMLALILQIAKKNDKLYLPTK
jgi:hypothetical protein